MKASRISLFILSLMASYFTMAQEVVVDQKEKTIKNEIVRIEPGFNFRYNLSYNYRILHNNFTLGYNFGNHHLYAGLGHVAILPPFGNPLRVYKKHTLGETVGYRNYFLTDSRNINYFAQFQFNFYPVIYSVPVLLIDRSTDFILENSLSIGGEYTVWRNYKFNLGFGIGSTDGIFIIQDSFFLLAFTGLQYHLGYKLPRLMKKEKDN